MALTFATNSLHLANWGVSIGDLAVLAGAGRGVVTWLTANVRDGHLLDFLNVAEKELRFRPGLLDPVALNRRWGTTVALFNNGRRVEHTLQASDQSLENVGRFTWMMTLVVAALDVSTSNSMVQQIVIEYTMELFKTAVLHIEYLEHEIPQHLAGWRSTACTRNITTRARDLWTRLEGRENHHLPGFIPTLETNEIVRFLLWMSTGAEPQFVTNSTDVFSLAALLGEVGFDRLRIGLKGDLALEHLDESSQAVVLDVNAIAKPLSSLAPLAQDRPGMRIPLEAPEEVVSLWPLPLDMHNRLRALFREGMKVSTWLNITACCSAPPDQQLEGGFAAYFEVTAKGLIMQDRVEPAAYNFTKAFQLLSTSASCKALEELLASWPMEAVSNIQTAFVLNKTMPGITEYQCFVPRHDRVSRATARTYTFTLQDQRRCLSELKSLLLGYAYGFLSTVLDTSQLKIPEAFGSWGWNDMYFFEILAHVVSHVVTNRLGDKGYLKRCDILRLAAFLYAGAEKDQVSHVSPDHAGLHAKLTIVTPGLIGDADTPQKVGRFVLLDIDPTSIPSHGQGFITSGTQARPMRTHSRPPEQSLDLQIPFAMSSNDPDFSVHIEPAWKLDTNLCMVTYRYKGRVVHNVDPFEAEASVLRWWEGVSATSPSPSIQVPLMLDLNLIASHRPGAGLQDAYRPRTYSLILGSTYAEHVGSHTVSSFGPKGMDHDYRPAQESSAAALIQLVASAGRPRARACIAAMYGIFARGRDKTSRTVMKDFAWDTVSSNAVVIQLGNTDDLIVIL